MKNPKKFLSKFQTASDFNPRLRIFVDEYEKYKKNYNKRLLILDIGCGKNAELYDHKKSEDDYSGCDFYPSIRKKIDNYISIDLNEEKLTDKITNKKFDVIFCGEVIEHLFSPDDLLDEIRLLMHPDSILILSTPNLAYWLNRLMLLFGLSPLFLESSSDVKMGRRFKFLGQGNKAEGHIRLFTYGALRDLFKRKSFNAISIRPVSIFNFWPDLFFSLVSKSFSADNVFVLKKS